MPVTGKHIEWVAYDEMASLSEKWVFHTFNGRNRVSTSTAIPASIEASDFDLGKALGVIQEDHANDAAIWSGGYEKPNDFDAFKAKIISRVSEMLAKRDARIDELSSRIVDLEQKLDLILAIQNNENFGKF